jgi:putative membrane protein
MITMMYWYGSGMSGWGYALMTVSMILFWGAVIAGVVALVRYFGRSGQEPPLPPPPQSAGSPSAPERLLAERFARGEINEDEYRQRLAVLRGTDQPANGQVRPPAGARTQ